MQWPREYVKKCRNYQKHLPFQYFCRLCLPYSLYKQETLSIFVKKYQQQNNHFEIQFCADVDWKKIPVEYMCIKFDTLQFLW